MEFTEIITLLIKIVVLVLSIVASVLFLKIKNYLAGKLTEQQLQQLFHYIKVFVDAAEQQLKEEDPTGEKRKAYVVQHLTTIGVQVDEQIDAMIEAQVLQLKQ